MTFVYVTHDQEEALSMSDWVAVINEGRRHDLTSEVGKGQGRPAEGKNSRPPYELRRLWMRAPQRTSHWLRHGATRGNDRSLSGKTCNRCERSGWPDASSLLGLADLQ